MAAPSAARPHREGDWEGLLRQIIGLGAIERDPRSVARRVAELVAEAAGAEACFVHFLDPEANELVLMGATPESFDELGGTIRLRVGEGIAGWVAEHGEAAIVENKWEDPRYVYIPALRGEEFSSLVSVPLLRPGGVVVGVLNTHSRHPNHFSAEHADRLFEVASLLAGIVENSVLVDRLGRREEELAQFAASTIELQENDRRRVAADIHDGISQRLVSAWYHLRAAREGAGPGPAREEIARAEALITDALADARRTVMGLRPVVLDDLGLAAALTSLAASLGSQVTHLDLDELELPPHVEASLFRIAQEALQNVVKHSQAREVSVKLRGKDGTVTLTVADDGVGFDQSASPGSAGSGSVALGLRGIQERAALLGATLSVESAPGEGTRLKVVVPPTAA